MPCQIEFLVLVTLLLGQNYDAFCYEICPQWGPSTTSSLGAPGLLNPALNMMQTHLGNT